MRSVLAAAVGTACLIAALPAVSHHSFTAEFDVNRPIELTGTVTSIQWTNPHAWLFLDTEDSDGSIQSWKVELLGINTLMRRGWTRDRVEPGDLVNVTGYGSRDGSNTGNASMVAMADTGELLWESADE